MNKFYTFWTLFCLVSGFLLPSCGELPVAKKEKSPRELYPELFDAVQTRKIFVDSKTFVDCIPTEDPADIYKEYKEQSKEKSFDLKAFVHDHFELPQFAGSEYHSNIKEGAEKHVRDLWTVLTRKADVKNPYSSLLELPNSYVVPGGRFQEIYYWDSYFTMLGLQECNRMDLVEGMINNFAFLIRTYGFIPNGNRTYYLTRSQPPYFSLMLRLLMEAKPSQTDSILKANMNVLQKEYYFWMQSDAKKEGASQHVVYLSGGDMLNRYYDKGNTAREESYVEDLETAKLSGNRKDIFRDLRSGAESGWDYSSRWFEDGRSIHSIRTTSIMPVDLNCLLYDLETLLALAYQRAGDNAAAQKMREVANRRKNAIMKYCWDSSSGWFQDYDFVLGRKTGRLTLAGVYPLYFKLVTRSRADSAMAVLNKQFLKQGGLVTSLTNTGQQWDAPNGWAPLQWMAYKSVLNYKNIGMATEIARRWLSQNERVFNKTGKMTEKYNVLDTSLVGGGGEYPNQDGFGWTNGVYLKMKKEEQLRQMTVN